MTLNLKSALVALRDWLGGRSPVAGLRILPLTPSHGWLLPAASIVRSQWAHEARPRFASAPGSPRRG